MKMLNKFLSLLLSILFFVSIAPKSFAAQNVTANNLLDKENELEWIDFSEISDLDIEDTYSYDELVEYLKENGFTENEIKNYIGEKIPTRSTTIRYALMKMTPHSYYLTNNYSLQARFTVGLEYIGNSASPDRMVSLEGAHVFSSDPDTTDNVHFSECAFSGSITYKLVSGREIYYNFYGTMYRTGVPNWSFGIAVPIGGTATSTVSISNGDGQIRNVSEYRNVIMAGLSA